VYYHQQAGKYCSVPFSMLKELLFCNVLIAALRSIIAVDAALFDTTFLDTTLPNIGLLDIAVF
jgi:hypothetical protein